MTGEALAQFHHPGMVISVAFSPDGRHIVLCSMEKTICLWDTDTRQPQGSWQFEDDLSIVEKAALSPDGNSIAFASAGNNVALWDVQHNQTLGQFVGYTD
jgi:WD40 repeat protein